MTTEHHQDAGEGLREAVLTDQEARAIKLVQQIAHRYKNGSGIMADICRCAMAWMREANQIFTTQSPDLVEDVEEPAASVRRGHPFPSLMVPMGATPPSDAGSTTREGGVGVPKLKPGYPDYVDDPDGLDRFRDQVRRDSGHDMADCNNNSLGRLIDTIERLRRERDAALATTPSPDSVSARDKVITALRDYLASAGVPATEFDPEFVVRMMAAMMVSFHKYGRVADAYPVKFDAVSDMRARIKKYRETGNLHFLVDVANFAMIETMHPARSGATWGSNDAADSPGRTTASGHRLVQEDNAGNRIMGETILHIPGDDA